jgi:hypothetical protein
MVLPGRRWFHDINVNGEVTILDTIGYDPISGVPEPVTMSLFGAGLAILAVYKRRPTSRS